MTICDPKNIVARGISRTPRRQLFLPVGKSRCLLLTGIVSSGHFVDAAQPLQDCAGGQDP